jgi:protein-histidine pros-kinase
MLSPVSLPGVPDCDPLTEGLLIVDESGAILFANEQMSHLFGYQPEDLQGRIVEHLMPERFRMTHIGHRLQFTDERRIRPMGYGRGLVLCCKDGSERPVRISLRPVQRGLETLVVATIQLVTDLSERN